MREKPPDRGIAIFLTGDFPEGKAANSRIKAISKGLLTAGYEPQLIFLWASAFNNSGINKESQGDWEGIHFHYANNSCKRPRSAAGKIVDSLNGSFSAAFWLLQHRKKVQLCYVYSGEVISFLPVYLAARLSGLPVIVERTELRSVYPFRKYRGFFRSFFRFDERSISKFADHLIVISQLLYSHYLERFGKENLTVVPVLTDIGRFDKDQAVVKKRNMIGYIGTFGDKDCVPEILQAFAEARRINKDLKLRMIGFYGEKKTFEKLMATMGLHDHVEFTGQVAYSEVPRLLKECDLLLMNRDSSPYSSYGSAAKVGEYLAAEVPAIITRVGDIENYLKHGRDAWLIEPGNTEQLAEAILERYARYEEFEQIGKNGRNACEKWFSIERNMPPINSIIERITGRYSTPLTDIPPVYKDRLQYFEKEVIRRFDFLSRFGFILLKTESGREKTYLNYYCEFCFKNKDAEIRISYSTENINGIKIAFPSLKESDLPTYNDSIHCSIWDRNALMSIDSFRKVRFPEISERDFRIPPDNTDLNSEISRVVKNYCDFFETQLSEVLSRKKIYDCHNDRYEQIFKEIVYTDN